MRTTTIHSFSPAPVGGHAGHRVWHALARARDDLVAASSCETWKGPDRDWPPQEVLVVKAERDTARQEESAGEPAGRGVSRPERPSRARPSRGRRG